MLYLLIKAGLSGVIVALVSETARRSPGLGALLASLPLIDTPAGSAAAASAGASAAGTSSGTSAAGTSIGAASTATPVTSSGG